MVKTEIRVSPPSLDSKSDSDIDECDMKNEMLRFLALHQCEVLLSLQTQEAKLNGKIQHLRDGYKKRRSEIKKMKTLLVDVEVKWFAHTIAASIIKNAKRKISKSSLHILSDKKKIHIFRIPLPKYFGEAIRAGCHKLAVTVSRVNHYLEKVGIGFFGIEKTGFVRFQFL